MAVGNRLPRFTAEQISDPVALADRLNRFVTALEIRLTALEGPLTNPRDPAAGEEVFAISNVTEDRTYDANSTTLAEVADVLGTLIADLINEDRLR